MLLNSIIPWIYSRLNIQYTLSTGWHLLYLGVMLLVKLFDIICSRTRSVRIDVCAPSNLKGYLVIPECSTVDTSPQYRSSILTRPDSNARGTNNGAGPMNRRVKEVVEAELRALEVIIIN